MTFARKLTFLLIIFALVMPVTMARAADMQNCPHMSSSVPADQDMPCHGNHGQKKAEKADQTASKDTVQSNCSDCDNNCDNCKSCVTGTMLFAPGFKTDLPNTKSAWLSRQGSFKAFAPEALRHPPKFFS